jgi:hypothetical protein
MIARSESRTPQLASGDSAALEACTAALEKVSLLADSLADSFARLREGFDQAADRWTKVQAASSPLGSQPERTPPPLPPPSAPPPGVPEAIVDLANRLGTMTRQIQSDPSQGAIYESLAGALSLMNEIAAQTASQAELRQIAAQVESLRTAVNRLQSRANVDRLP